MTTDPYWPNYLKALDYIIERLNMSLEKRHTPGGRDALQWILDTLKAKREDAEQRYESTLGGIIEYDDMFDEDATPEEVSQRLNFPLWPPK